jgi:hypothetical protein
MAIDPNAPPPSPLASPRLAKPWSVRSEIKKARSRAKHRAFVHAYKAEAKVAAREAARDEAATVRVPESPAAAAATAAVATTGEATLGQQIKGFLQHNLEEYARLHVEAARVAALKGDARPAEWALQTIKVGDGPVVTPVAKEGGGGGGGVKVLIGVQLGGLPPGTIPSTAISVSAPPADDTTPPEAPSE